MDKCPQCKELDSPRGSFYPEEGKCYYCGWTNS